MRALNKFYNSGRWLRGSQRHVPWNGTRRCGSLARLFPSSRLEPPPNAASNPSASSACLSASVFITCVWSEEPEAIGIDPASEALMVDMDDQIETKTSRRPRPRNEIISLNFHVVSTCSSGKGKGAG